MLSLKPQSRVGMKAPGLHIGAGQVTLLAYTVKSLKYLVSGIASVIMGQSNYAILLSCCVWLWSLSLQLEKLA